MKGCGGINIIKIKIEKYDIVDYILFDFFRLKCDLNFLKYVFF